jgi:hypothetical protein
MSKEKFSKAEAIEVIESILKSLMDGCDVKTLNSVIANIKHIKIKNKKAKIKSSCVFVKDHYVKLIGRSDSAEEIAATLSSISPAFSEIYPGITDTKGFWIRINRGESPSNGWYKLCVVAGDPDNKICKTFKLELTQYPLNKVKAIKVVYPPVSGNRKILNHTDTVREASSIDNIMGETLLASAPNPEVVFSLKHKLESAI